MATRFSETNCGAQCKTCNWLEQGAETKHEEYILETYGENELNKLKAAKHSTCKIGSFEMKTLENYYKQKAQELAKEKGLKI